MKQHVNTASQILKKNSAQCICFDFVFTVTATCSFLMKNFSSSVTEIMSPVAITDSHSFTYLELSDLQFTASFIIAFSPLQERPPTNLSLHSLSSATSAAVAGLSWLPTFANAWNSWSRLPNAIQAESIPSMPICWIWSLISLITKKICSNDNSSYFSAFAIAFCDCLNTHGSNQIFASFSASWW